jgi:thiol-disulfide isomerase/thioredoxin
MQRGDAMQSKVLCVVVLLTMTALAWGEEAATTQGSRLLVKTLMNVSRQPIAGVTINWEADGGANGKGETSASGEYTIIGVTSRCSWLMIKVSQPGLVPLRIYWNTRNTDDSSAPINLPPFLFLMEKSARISGHIVDETGKPISQATVIIDVIKKYPGSEQRVDSSWETTTSDSSGLWSFDNVPASGTRFYVGAYDFKHLQDADLGLNEYESVADLYNSTAKLTLHTGTPVQVTVLKPDGTTAGGAKLFIGNSTRGVNKYAWAKTDASGQFTFGCKPNMASLLTAISADFGPAQTVLSVGAQAQKIILHLTQPSNRTIDVVDSQGKPIEGAMVIVTKWKNTDTLGIQIKTDKSGHAIWTSGPSDDVTAEVDSDNAQQEITWSAGKPMRVVLHSPTVFAGRVIDAQTGASITNYTIRLAATWHQGEQMVWQSYDSGDLLAMKKSGQFTISFSNPAYRYFMRVQSDGYLPEDTEPFDPNGAAQTFELRLKKSEPITGELVTVNHRPVAGADIYLALSTDWLGLIDGQMHPGMENNYLHVKSDTDGRFSIPPQKDDCLLVILSDQGSAIIKRHELTTSDQAIELLPWATIQGTIFMADRPAVETQITANSSSIESLDGTVLVARQYFFATDKEGHFKLPRVFPGSLVLKRMVPNHSPGRMWYIDVGSINVQPAQDCTVNFGQADAVTGQLSIPPGKQWMIREARLEPMGQPHITDRENVEVLDDGRFRADGLTPGQYSLYIALHEFPPGNSCGWGRVVGEYNRQITLTGDHTTLHAGTIAPDPIIESELKPGDPMPDLAIKTLDGQALRISSLKGKVVLVDFWASWCAPCVAEIPNMRTIAAAHAHDKFFMLSLSEDEDLKEATRMAKLENITWPQAWVGTDSPCIKTCGASAIPASFLIGPDGRIISRDLRGNDLQKAVQTALNN